MAEPVNAPLVTGIPRGADFQKSIAELNAALQDWRRTRKYSPQTEERLAQITVQCARVAEAWQQMDRRGTAANAVRRSGWSGVERRRDEDPGARIRALERTIEHEWEGLSDGFQGPGDELESSAASAGDRAASATSLTLRGLATFETRLAALERDLQGRMEQLSRDLQIVVAELRSARQPPQGQAAAFPLESVMRIHEELRDPSAAPPPGAAALKPGAVRALPEAAESTMALTARLESLEKAVSTAVAPEPARGWRRHYPLLAVLAVSLAGMAVLALWMQRRVDTRLDEAAARVTAAEQQRDTTVAATRTEAAKEVAEARQTASQAQTVSTVLAAPDRIRYWMAGVGPYSRAYAQVLFSRSRGIVFSASRLPAAPAGKVYQLWLVTRGGPVNAGTVTPDGSGRVTMATDVPDGVRTRVLTAVVTLESAGELVRPSRQRVLIRVE